jgi:hypothetical protein
MYRFLVRGARTSFAFIAPLLVSGCSVLPAEDTTKSLDLPEGAIEGVPECRSTDHLSTTPSVYKCQTDREPVYFTSLRDCSLPEKFSHQATTRQLLIGVTNLHMVRQEPVLIGNMKALHSLVDGVIDVDPVILSTFTFRKGNCVTDLVVWRVLPIQDQPTEQSDDFSAFSRRLAERLVASNAIGGFDTHGAG